MDYTKDQLIHFTLFHSLFPETTLKKAIEKLQFVQIDPIRSPAPAQDLILRHRVKDYQIGDIDAQYTQLQLEEDFLYAHGYLVKEVWQLLHPRLTIELTEFDRQVLKTVEQMNEIYPKELDQYFEKKSERNWWGGVSRSSRMSLERLHYYGLLRVVRREKGQRIYQAFSPSTLSSSLEERLSKLILVMVDIMAPVSKQTLSQSLHRIHRHFGKTTEVIKQLVKSGQLVQQTVEGVTYFWPYNSYQNTKPPQLVRFLSPFDPVVRDRVRFEHLWGWLYQFEAYVPAAKRIRGYYAMPLLWGQEMIGWVNAKVVDKKLEIEPGFIASRPKEKEFDLQLAEEIERMKHFLRL